MGADVHVKEHFLDRFAKGVLLDGTGGELQVAEVHVEDCCEEKLAMVGIQPSTEAEKGFFVEVVSQRGRRRRRRAAAAPMHRRDCGAEPGMRGTLLDPGG